MAITNPKTQYSDYTLIDNAEKIDADSASGAFSRYVDVFCNEKEKPERLTVYGTLRSLTPRLRMTQRNKINTGQEIDR